MKSSALLAFFALLLAHGALCALTGKSAFDLARLRTSHGNNVKVGFSPSSGIPSYVTLHEGFHVATPLTRGEGESHLDAFLREYNIFNLRSNVDTFKTTISVKSPHMENREFVTYQQLYRGVPVFGRLVRTTLRGNDLHRIMSKFLPDIDLATVTPRLSAQEAVSAGTQRLAEMLSVPVDTLTMRGETELVVADTSLGAPNKAATPMLVYKVDIKSKDGQVHFRVFVNAATGAVEAKYPLSHSALNRSVHEGELGSQPIWVEGQPIPQSPRRLTDTIENTRYVYEAFQNVFNIDSWDTQGGEMISILNSTEVECPNAFWNGMYTAYCWNTATPDIIAHEWQHAFTQGNGTHDLIYAYQPGALNEAYSDITGETISVTRSPHQLQPTNERCEDCCSTHTPPVLQVFFEGFSAASTILVEANTGTSFNGRYFDGVQIPSDPENQLLCDPEEDIDFDGGLVLVSRGSCSFVTKATNAIAAGAGALIIYQNSDDAPFGPSIDNTINIPVGMIERDSGLLIAAIAGLGFPVAAAFGPSETTHEDSFLWLVGEDDPAGGAIRDMWTPSCYGHPDSTDSNFYACGESDNGGVHSNSGVPNNNYAQWVTYLGSFEVAWPIYMHALLMYGTPTTDFADHHAALSMACDDFVGMPIKSFVDGNTLAFTLISEHCMDLEGIGADQFLPPTRCLYPGGFDAAPFVSCEDAVTLDDLPITTGADANEWTFSDEGVDSESFLAPAWTFVPHIPGAMNVGALFAENGGDDCVSPDFAGIRFAGVPSFTVPETAGDVVVVFKHYFVTEPEYDGGFVRYSVNGGDFMEVTEEDFIYNGYNGYLNGDSPVPGMAVFTGTKPGTIEGDHIESAFRLDVSSGDVVTVEFAFVQDACFGVDGWYINWVSIEYCPVVCGDSFCSSAETCSSCLEDCECVCGNGICEVFEDPNACKEDCAADGYCQIGEVNDDDCCGIMDDCSFENPESGWKVESVLDQPIVIYNDEEAFGGRVFPQGHGGILLLPTYFYSSDASYSDVVASVSKRMVVPVEVGEVWLVFDYFTECYYSDFGTQAVSIFFNDERVWTLEDACLTASSSTTSSTTSSSSSFLLPPSGWIDVEVLVNVEPSSVITVTVQFDGPFGLTLFALDNLAVHADGPRVSSSVSSSSSESSSSESADAIVDDNEELSPAEVGAIGGAIVLGAGLLVLVAGIMVYCCMRSPSSDNHRGKKGRSSSSASSSSDDFNSDSSE